MPSTDSPALDAAWNRLKYFYLSKSLNQSTIENNLPFGMRRDLKPLEKSFNDEFDRIGALKRAVDFNLGLEMISNSKDVSDRFKALKLNRFKFIPHKPTSTTITNGSSSSASASVMTRKFSNSSISMLKFDPSALLFFKEDAMTDCNAVNNSLPTNLTSNANGTVSYDKKSAGGIFQQSCWLVSQGDLLQGGGPMTEILPSVQNNKLRILKCLEFLDQEWRAVGPDLGLILDFVALTKDEVGRGQGLEGWMLLKSHRRTSIENDLYIFDGETCKLKYSTSQEMKPLNSSGTIFYLTGLKIEIGDLIVAIKHSNNNNNNNKKFILKDLPEKLKKALTADYEKISEDFFYGEKGLEAVLISRVTGLDDFENSFKLSKRPDIDVYGSIKYVSHLDTKIGSIVLQPPPGTYGCTTRHSVIYRPDHFAALHHDASKINRFPDTLNYIIRKLLDPSNDNLNMSARLKRLSEIQYYAYVVRREKGDAFVIGLGGGAKALLFQSDTNLFQIHESSRITRLNMEKFKCDHPVDLILLSPHFSLQNFEFKGDISTIISKLCDQIDDLTNFKVSLCHFQIIIIKK